MCIYTYIHVRTTNRDEEENGGGQVPALLGVVLREEAAPVGHLQSFGFGERVGQAVISTSIYMHMQVGIHHAKL